MVFPTTTSGVASAAAACVLATSLVACAAPREAASPASSASAAAAPLRVMVKLVRGSADAMAIATEASGVAGVPVSYAAATTLTWHALTLHCASAAQCDAAIARLRAAGTIYQAVEIDGRKTPAS
jgi:hypothetical protein